MNKRETHVSVSSEHGNGAFVVVVVGNLIYPIDIFLVVLLSSTINIA